MACKVAVLALAFLCVPTATDAEECAYARTVSPPLSQDWHVERGDGSARAGGRPYQPALLQPFDRLVIPHGSNTIVVVRQKGGTDDRTMSVGPADGAGDAVLIVPPCAPRQDMTETWHHFWAAMNPRRSMRSLGATLIWRGLETGAAARQGGPLRDLTTLAPAQGTVSGTSGFGLAWIGGSPPYRVAVEDEASGTPLVHAHTAVAELWLPGWTTPSAPFVVIVTDSQGVTFWRHLRPLPPPPAGGNELGDAVALFETAPDYRLEALRRLFIRSRSGDALATRAIALIRAAGAGP